MIWKYKIEKPYNIYSIMNYKKVFPYIQTSWRSLKTKNGAKSKIRFKE